MQFTGTIDPKWGQWLSLIAFILSGLAMASWWQDFLTAKQVAAVVGVMNLTVSALNYVLHGMPAPASAALPPAPRMPIIALLIGGVLILGLLQGGTAYAQTRAPAPRATGNPIADIGTAIAAQKQTAAATRNADTEDLVAKLGKLALPDFQFALAMSKATNNVVSTPCWEAWVTLLTAQQKPLLAADGTTPITEPDPHLATSVEKISELLAALRPDSPLSTGCAALAGAAGKDAATLIQGILGGGALGLFKLPIPIGPIP